MQLNKVNGNTFYVNMATNIGIYTYKNKNCLLVDTGSGTSTARKIHTILSQNKLHPKYIINTHSHLDHCSGNHFFQENYPGCEVYASSIERVYMENPHLYASMLFSSDPIKELYKKHKPFKVDFELEYGFDKINDEKFEIISLTGHSVGQIGIVTPDRVCFLGDSVFSNEIVEKYSLPYLYNIKDSIETLNKMKTINADYFIISHAEGFITKEQLLETIEVNINNIDKYTKQIYELLEQPHTREEILENLIILNDLPLNFTQYHLYFSSISAFITYLSDSNMVSYSLNDGKIYYFQTR